MAVPTISTVSPAAGPTSGGNLVEITGTGFKLWTIPAANGRPSGPLLPTVRVRFNGIPSSNVMVVSATKLLVQPPASPLPGNAAPYTEGTVAVEVANLDADGAVIAGEVATTAGTFYAFRRVQLATESDFNRLCRALIRLVKAQVHPNVAISTHTDYDPAVGDELNRVGLAQLPGIALLGPEMTENRIHSINGTYVVPLSGGTSAIRRAPYTVDLVFSMVGITEQNQQALNLMAAAIGFFRNNTAVSMLADPADPSRGWVTYELQVMPSGEPKMDPSPDNANRHVFTAKFRIVGFDIEDLAGFPGAGEVSRTAQIVEDPAISLESNTVEES